MKIMRAGYALPLHKAFSDLIDKHLEGKEGPVVLNFRDPGYGPGGGFHPVEIRVEADGKLSYVTDFSFVGSPAELAKELDFDFGLGLFQQQGRDFPIERGRGLFPVFQSNFVSYFRWGVFTVTVKEER